MKTLKQTFTLAVILTAALNVSAKTATNFDEIIEENIKTEKALSQQLQKDAGIVREKIEAKPSLVINPKEDKGEPDQVVVSSSKSIFKTNKKRHAIRQNKEEMKRLSQEIKEATNQ